MKVKLLLTVFTVLSFSFGISQNLLWKKIEKEESDVKEKVERASFPKEYHLFNLDFEKLKVQLQTAPSRNTGTISDVVIAFPDGDGNLNNYRIYESSVMEADLAVLHPEIQSYVGEGIEDRTARIFLTTTIFGLHTMTISGRGTFYTDPYTKDLQDYIVYKKSSLTNPQNFQCHTKEVQALNKTLNAPQTVFAGDGLFRTYRLAMACTVEYAAFHINQAGVNSGTLTEKKAAVLAAMNVTVARVNSVYEIDMSLRMVLVANNSNIIYVTTDSFSNDDPELLIEQSQTVITSAINSANFDIGHTVSTGGGGLAQGGSVCTFYKAMGITGLPSPVGDPFNIDYVAHEIGHQFGANHTFNGTGGSCTGNRAQEQAVEPGSGSTIMGYAGICANNVQNNSDAYFHIVSIDEMMVHITGEGNCVVGVPNGNTAPTVPILSNYIIPKGTPFVLRGNATDVDGDTLTYCWEQTNPGVNTSNPSATTTSSNPNFRSFSPSTSPNRYFPAMNRILTNNLTSTWEVIPNVARTMNFALTVRDNKTPNGGQTTRKNTMVVFNAASGPFVVTSQNTAGITWTNTPQTITWNVANTNVAPVNTANVNILMSIDGGLTFPIVLAANTLNDGSEVVMIPSVTSSTCRIMVEAVNNIFLAVNTTSFAVNNGLGNESFGLKYFKLYPNPNTGNFNIEFESETSNTIKIVVYDIRGRQIFDKAYQNSGLFSQNLQLDNVQAGIYLVNVHDGERKEIRKIVIN